jgi:hypothetical protein
MEVSRWKSVAGVQLVICLMKIFKVPLESWQKLLTLIAQRLCDDALECV